MTALDDAMVVGHRPRITGRSLISMVIVAVAYLIWAALTRHYFVLVAVAVVYLYQLGVAARPPAVVSVDGIRRPWRRRSSLAWTEIDSVAKPELGSLGVRLNLVGGKKLSLTDIPADQSAAVAAIGGKEVAPTAALPRPAPPPPRPPTDEERHANVAREAANLSAGWRRLAEESGRVHPPRPSA